MEMWKHVKYPVRSALCASYLLREMSTSQHAEPLTRSKMLKTADLFEEKAIAVQTSAEKDDLDMACKPLDCQLFLFNG